MLSRHSTRACGGLLLFGLLAFAVGCGPNYKARGTVKGTVTFAGKNLTAGSVVFYGKDNLTGSASIRTDGTYVINDAPLGDVKITVTVPQMPPGGVGYMKGAPAGPVMPGESASSATTIPSNVVSIPQKYANVETSGLTYTVQRGEQTHDIPLTP
jgi:hypothetical protein